MVAEINDECSTLVSFARGVVEYDDYAYKVPNFGAPPVTGCPYSVVAGGQYQLNCSGKVPPQAPKRSFNFGLQQTIPIGNYSVVGDIRTHYQSATLTGQDFAPIEEQNPYWMSDATLGLHAPNDHWIVTGYVNNLSDATVIQGSFPNPLAGFSLTAATLRTTAHLRRALHGEILDTRQTNRHFLHREGARPENRRASMRRNDRNRTTGGYRHG